MLQQYLPFTVLKLTVITFVRFNTSRSLQQYLPFTVLKQSTDKLSVGYTNLVVATVLTVYGIETRFCFTPLDAKYFVATVLTVYGIETFTIEHSTNSSSSLVATVLTVYGIETIWFP